MNNVGGCLLRIREMSQTLSSKEHKLASFILDNSSDVVNLNITSFADTCGVSLSTVTRFCRKLNYSGYKELCRNLYSDLQSIQDNPSFEDIYPGGSPYIIMQNTCYLNIEAIKDTMTIMDNQELDKAVQVLSKAERIDFYGVGNSGLVALDAGSKFIRIKKFVQASMDPHHQILSALSLTKDDVAMIISFSGETTDIITIAREIKKIGATIISLTKYGKNSLKDLADIHLHSCSPETQWRSSAMSSRIAQLAIIDALYVSVCSRNFDTLRSKLEQTTMATQKVHTLSKDKKEISKK